MLGSRVHKVPFRPSFLFTLCGAALAPALAAHLGLAQAAGGEAARLRAAVAAIEAGRTSTPIIDDDGGDEVTVTFFAKLAGTRVPRVISDVTGWGEHIDGTFDYRVGKMTRVGESPWFALRAKVARGARIEYLLAYGVGDYRLDPFNPRRAPGPQFNGARASEFVTPGYAPPPALAASPAAPGSATFESTLESRALAERERVIVYTPAGYRDDRPYPLAVFLDSRVEPVSKVLDWLIDRQAIEPVVAVFEGPAARGGDIPTSAQVGQFLTRELLPWVESRYRVAPDAERRAVLGVSFAGKDALHAAVVVGAFDRLGLLIPGRRIGPPDLASIGTSRSRHLRVAILAGRYDQANLPTARALRQAFDAAGDSVQYLEVPEGHSPATWLNHVAEVLIALFRR